MHVLLGDQAWQQDGRAVLSQDKSKLKRKQEKEALRMHRMAEEEQLGMRNAVPNRGMSKKQKVVDYKKGERKAAGVNVSESKKAAAAMVKKADKRAAKKKKEEEEDETVVAEDDPQDVSPIPFVNIQAMLAYWQGRAAYWEGRGRYWLRRDMLAKLRTRLPLQAEEEEEATWDLEKILAVGRVKAGNTLHYLVRWAGYDSSDDCWLIKQDVGIAAIKEFEQANPDWKSEVVIGIDCTAFCDCCRD